MKRTINKVREIIKNTNKREIYKKIAVFSLCTGIMLLKSNVVFAAGIDTGKLSAFDDIIDFILSLATKLGAGLAVWGLIDIALSFKSDNPEQKEKGQKLLMSAIALLCVGTGGSYFKSL